MQQDKSDLIRYLMSKGDSRPYRTIYLGTHDGDIHADDLLATAVLMHELEPLGYKITVIRSRNKHKLDECDIVYDVGGGKYDHHGNDRVYYPNGIPMAACGKILNDVITDPKMIEGLRTRLFYAVEAHDNGVMLPDGYESSKLAFISTLNPTWEEDSSPKAMLRRFYKAADIVKRVYSRIIAVVQADINAVPYINEFAVPILGGKFLMMDRYCPAHAYMRQHEECLGTIYKKDSQWMLRLAPTFKKRYETRITFPQRMCGLAGDAFVTECGIAGAIFCHPCGFIACMSTKEGCYELARQILTECTE